MGARVLFDTYVPWYFVRPFFASFFGACLAWRPRVTVAGDELRAVNGRKIKHNNNFNIDSSPTIKITSVHINGKTHPSTHGTPTLCMSCLLECRIMS